MRESRLALACALGSAVPVLVAVWFVQGFSLVAPLFDQWTLLPIYARYASGHPQWLDFIAPHNGLHVAFFMRLLLAALAKATGWSFRAEIFVGLSFVLYTAWILSRAYAESLPGPEARPVRAVVSLLTVGLLFSPAQDWIWTWSIGIFHYFENACVATAVWALARRQPRLGIAAVACSLATFNRFEGMFTWVLFLPAVLAASGRRARRWPALLVFFGIGFLSCTVCILLILLVRPAEIVQGAARGAGPGTAASLEMGASLVGMAPGLVTESHGVAAALGAPFFPAGVVVLAALVAAGAAALGSRAMRPIAWPWVGLGAFAVVFAFATAIVRSEIVPPEMLGIARWYQSSYSATASLGAVAAAHLSGLVHTCAPAGRPKRLLFPALAVAAVLLLGLDTAHAVPRLVDRRADGHWDRYCVELARYLAPANGCTVPLEGARAMERAGFATLRKGLRFDVTAPPLGRIEGTAVIVRFQSGTEALAVHGTVDLPEESAGTVVLAFGEERQFFVAASRFEKEGTGLRFTAVVPPRAVEPGRTVIRAWAYDARARRFRVIEGEADAAVLLHE